MWLKHQLQHSMLADNRGQGYTEYVVLLAAVLAIAGIVVATITLVGGVFQRQQGRINALP
jgi:uncharacterized protein (UPF0333 family)